MCGRRLWVVDGPTRWFRAPTKKATIFFGDQQPSTLSFPLDGGAKRTHQAHCQGAYQRNVQAVPC